MLRFAAKNAFRRKSIAILALIGVAIGASLMTAMASLSATITDQTNTFAQANLDSIRVQQLGQLYYNSRINLSELYSITQIDHIDAYSAQVIQQVIVAGGTTFSPQLVGVNIENDTETDGVTSKISLGRVFQDDNECIISEATANWVDVEIGDELPFLTPSLDWCNLTIVGVYEGFTFFGIISIYTTLDTARQFKTNFTNDTYSILLIKSDIPDNVKYIADEIGRISEEENLGLEAVSPEEQLEIATEFTGTINIVVLAISVIAGIAGGMSIVVAMLMSVIDRMKEFATLKATDWQNSDVVKDIVYESLIVTLVGGMVGFGLGVVFLQLVQLFAAVILNPLRPSVFLQITLFVIVMGIIGGIYPAYKVSKASPVEILRGE